MYIFGDSTNDHSQLPANFCHNVTAQNQTQQQQQQNSVYEFDPLLFLNCDTEFQNDNDNTQNFVYNANHCNPVATGGAGELVTFCNGEETNNSLAATLNTLREAYDSTAEWTARTPCTNQTPLKCPQCRYSTCHRTDMLDHINSKHIRYPAFSCRYCTESYFSKRKMKEHVRRKHEQKVSEKQQRALQHKATATVSISSCHKRVAEVDISKEHSIKVTVQADLKKPKLRISCPICLCVPEKYHSTLCGHIFCESCIRQVADSIKACPMCQKPIDRKSIHPIYF